MELSGHEDVHKVRLLADRPQWQIRQHDDQTEQQEDREDCSRPEPLATLTVPTTS